MNIKHRIVWFLTGVGSVLDILGLQGTAAAHADHIDRVEPWREDQARIAQDWYWVGRDLTMAEHAAGASDEAEARREAHAGENEDREPAGL